MPGYGVNQEFQSGTLVFTDPMLLAAVLAQPTADIVIALFLPGAIMLCFRLAVLLQPERSRKAVWVNDENMEARKYQRNCGGAPRVPIVYRQRTVWSGGEAFPCRLKDYVDHNFRVGVHRGVVYAMGTYLRSHAFGHEMLRLRINHAVFFGYQIPRRF